VGRACGMNGGEEECVRVIGRKSEGKRPQETQDVGGQITFRCTI
jgi:hypothetical protein